MEYISISSNPVISHERGKDREVFTSGTYPWSFVTQIFHSGQPSHGGDRKAFEVDSDYPFGIFKLFLYIIVTTLNLWFSKINIIELHLLNKIL
jgi:hypothetical protein